MPKRQSVDENEEQAELVEEIIASQWFRGAGADIRIELLRYLFKHSHEKEGLKALKIGQDVLPRRKRPAGPAPRTKQEKAEQEAKDAEFDQKLAQAARQQCEELRRMLAKYNLRASTNKKWRLEFPKGTPRGGCKLEFVNQEEHARVTLGFWRSYLEPGRKVLVVCNAPLFYRDPTRKMVFRFVDMNMDEINAKTALKTLQDSYPDLFNSNVYVSHLYLFRGEVEARDYIHNWFLNADDIPISKDVSHLIRQAEIDESSSILLGNTRTNQFIRDIFENNSHEFRIRVCPETLGEVTLHYPNEQASISEAERLSSRRPALQIRREGDTLILADCPPRGQERDAYVVVTRMPNPSGEGVITMICSDYTRALGQVAHTLTDDDRLAETLKRMGLPLDGVSPPFFEALFVVCVRGADAAKPELLAWHTSD